MRNILLSTAAAIMVLGLSASPKAAETTNGSLQLQIDFYSSTALAQSQPLYFGLIDLALVQPGDMIVIGSDGKVTEKGQFKASGAHPGEMTFTSASPTALNNLNEIMVGSDPIKGGKSINGIYMKMSDGSECGLIDEMSADWDLKEISADGKSLPIHIGANFIYKPNGAMVAGKCSATAVLTAVY